MVLDKLSVCERDWWRGENGLGGEKLGRDACNYSKRHYFGQPPPTPFNCCRREKATAASSPRTNSNRTTPIEQLESEKAILISPIQPQLS